MARVIMGISVQKREDVATQVQSLLTEYGCYIRTRLGLHQVSEEECSEAGLIMLEFAVGATAEADELEARLKQVPSVVVKTMVF